MMPGRKEWEERRAKALRDAAAFGMRADWLELHLQRERLAEVECAVVTIAEPAAEWDRRALVRWAEKWRARIAATWGVANAGSDALGRRDREDVEKWTAQLADGLLRLEQECAEEFKAAVVADAPQ